MYAFEYHRPTSVADAVSLLKGAGDGVLMAGGMTLIPTLKQRLASPSDVIDLGGVGDLSRILVDRGSHLVIGALTTHAEVAASKDVQGWIPALAKLADGIGDPQVRNRGTIGGSVANNDPAADYPAAVVGLNATVHTNKRQIAGGDFFTGMGYWTRANAEQCLLATRGAPKRQGRDVRRLVVSPRLEHSRKPDEIYGRIERLMDGPYLEMFARNSRPGWDTWGNQADLFDAGVVTTRRWASSLKKPAELNVAPR